jgi:glycosyltransferase involved in cell wall biosynthesis
VRGLFRRTVAPSRPLAARLIASGLTDVHVVPHAGHLPLAEEARAGMREAPELLYLDALDDAHGLTVLIEAFVALAAHHPTVRLAIAGDGEHVDWYRHLVQERGLAERVRFLPRPAEDTELVRLLDDADVLVVPSLVAQAMPRSVVEATRRALPIVATRVGALEELLAPRGGLLVRPRDPAALCAHVLRLLGDGERYVGASRAGRENPLGLDPETHRRAMLALYDEAVHAHARPVVDAPDSEDLDLVARLHSRITQLEISTKELEERHRAAAAESQWLESVLVQIASGRLSRKICQWRGIRAIDEFPGLDAAPRA